MFTADSETKEIRDRLEVFQQTVAGLLRSLPSHLGLNTPQCHCQPCSHRSKRIESEAKFLSHNITDAVYCLIKEMVHDRVYNT